MMRVRALVRVSASPGRIIEPGAEVDVADDVAAAMAAAGQVAIVETGEYPEAVDPPLATGNGGEEAVLEGADPPSRPVRDGGEPPPAEETARLSMAAHDASTSTTRVKGIGPATADDLWERGRIGTLADLAGLSDAEVDALAPHYGIERAREWRAAARGLAGETDSSIA